ncbi:MAG: DUF262 domain-containing protein [bacterium]|nr:DUF262 domain-containing protein [bacterium]
MAVDVQQITGIARSVSQLLSNSRYGLDFYQREYTWRETEVGELVDDLVGRFLDEFDPSHEPTQVLSYRPYFLGPIVTAQRDGVRYLVDGQQRITTLTLLLIHLRHALTLEHPKDSGALNSLIFSWQIDKETFNLDVDERHACMSAILEGIEFDSHEQSESVRNIWDRYKTIEERFPHQDLKEKALPFFTNWLQHRVILVDIGAVDQDMALEIFETMNDRGLRLTNTDMLKSYLLARVRDEDQIRKLNDLWRRRTTELADAEKDAPAEFMKAWLRGNYAESQRQRKAKAAPGDFDIIGTAFHKWVRDHAEMIGLKRTPDFRRFVEYEFDGLSRRYLQLLDACHDLKPGLEAVFYNAGNGYTLQLPVILAAITPEDNDAAFREKAALVAGALDIFVARRMVNYRYFGYSTVVYTMFNLMKDIRNRATDEVREVLTGWLAGEKERVEGIRHLRLTQRNRRHIHYLLARVTSWIDSEMGKGLPTFLDYVNRHSKDPYEVEHIWADHFEWHECDFDNTYEFGEHRNKIGDLLLLPRSFNRSYGDMPYRQKVDHYNSQNPLARSLHPLAYQNNPNFLGLIKTYGFPFKPYPCAFTRTDIDERQELYRNLAEVIWDPARLGLG